MPVAWSKGPSAHRPRSAQPTAPCGECPRACSQKRACLQRGTTACRRSGLSQAQQRRRRRGRACKGATHRGGRDHRPVQEAAGTAPEAVAATGGCGPRNSTGGCCACGSRDHRQRAALGHARLIARLRLRGGAREMARSLYWLPGYAGTIAQNQQILRLLRYARRSSMTWAETRELLLWRILALTRHGLVVCCCVCGQRLEAGLLNEDYQGINVRAPMCDVCVDAIQSAADDDIVASYGTECGATDHG